MSSTEIIFEFRFNFRGVVKALTSSSEFGEEAKNVASNMNSPRRGTDCGDHPPITPMKLLRKCFNKPFALFQQAF